MFAKVRYHAWANRFYGKIPFDLATSGIPYATKDDMGTPEDLDDPKGPERLRHAIAKYNDVAEDEALTALGTIQALWVAYASLVSPGDDVLVEEPGYEPLVSIAQGAGANVVRFERPAETRFALDPARIERAMTLRTRVVAISNLHNPSGARADDETLRAIAKICASRGAHLLVDEVYAPFDALTDGTGIFRSSARKLAPNIVCTASLTKCYGLGPYRIGWMLGPRDVVARAADVIDATCGHLPIQHANLGAHAFARIEHLAERARRIAAGRRAQVEAWIATRSDLDWSTPSSGLFGFAKTRRAGDLLTLIESGARDHGVLVAAGTFFGIPNGFRLSWASLGGTKLDEALARLGKILP